MTTIRSTTDIAASPSDVWGALTDFASYERWNPFITHISGALEPGQKLSVRIEPPDARPLSFTPTLLTVRSEDELRWLGRFLLPRIVDGEHVFRLEPTDEGTRLIQEETFSGLLVPLIRSTIRKTQAGFEQMNAALKQRVERGDEAHDGRG
ncbi:MAG TPA: SRPBCC domain-containing protein [Gaiellales bacterium]|jgi:hypothetical protein